MTNKIYKISIVFSSLLLSLFLASCSQGDRGFVPLPEEPVEEVEADIFITGGAVKGPLINAEINIYKFELNQGPIYHLNNALSTWFKLLELNQVQETDDGSITLGELTAEDVLKNLKKSFDQFGYVTELEALKSDLESKADFTSAEVLVKEHIGTNEDRSDALESNTAVADEVEEILLSSATLSELKNKIGIIETLTDKLLETETFSEAKSVLNTYFSTETNAVKQEGFQRLINDLDSLSLKSNQFGLSQIKRYYKTNIYDVLLTDFTLQNDPVARQNLIELEADLDSASTVVDAESLIQKAYRKEGNVQVKAALSKLLSEIPTIDDLYELVDGDQSLYHDFTIKDELVTAVEAIKTDPNNNDPSQLLKDIINNTTEALTSRMEAAFRGSLIIDGDDDIPLNRLSFGVSNEQGLLPNLQIGQYRGFVYMEALSLDRTLDLNTGEAPIFEKMESIFHTDDILGNGDNSQEDETLYYLLNGDIQRDSDGEIITDSSLIENQTSDKLLEVKPSFFATPLTTIAVGLTLEKFKSLDNLKVDSDLDLMAENRITESLLKTSLKTSAKTVGDTFGIGLSEQNIFKSSPVRLAQMQYSQESELQAIQYRLSIENYASFLYELMVLTNQKDTDLLTGLISDLNDGQVDGFYKNQAVEQLSGIPQLQYLLNIHPSERVIPGTNIPVSSVYFLMNNELSTTLPSESVNAFSSNNLDVTVNAPAGGIDSDSDGVLDNDDQFPLDENKSRDLNVGYAGIWSAIYDNSQTEYMPFNEPLEFQFNVEELEGSCTNSPCIALGDITTPISATYDLISAPKNHDFIKTNVNNNGSIGFSAFATVPGDYLLKAELTTAIEPIQAYTVFIPINVINPRSIEIKFDPAEPQPGKSVSTLFKATKGLCHLYPVCSNIDLTDDVDDFLPLNLLSDIFSIEQNIDRDGEVLSYSSVNSSNPNQTSADLSNIYLKDSLALAVKFNAGDRSFTSASYQNVVGNEQDKDGDGVSDVSDFYPLDGSCHLEKDGILDTNFDGDVNSLDSPVCFESIQNEATKSFEISFLNETWYYKPNWHYIIRANSNQDGYNGYIEIPTLTGTKELVNFDLNLVDTITKRVYLAYKNGAVDYFSFETQSLQDFSPSYAFNPVKSMHLLGTYLLVEYGSDNVTKLFNKNSQIADIHGDVSYPYPGNAISLMIDNQNLLSATNNLFDIDWVLERESTDDNSIVNQLSILTSNDGLTLNSGQTAFGDVVKLSLNFNTEDNTTITIGANIFVLGIESMVFSEKNHEDDSPLIINLVNFDSELLPSDDSSLFVKWYKNNIDTDDYTFSLSDKRYPYVYEASNFELGDMIRGDVYIKHGAKELKITSLEAVILGDIQNDLVPTLDADISFIDDANRTVNLTLLKPLANDKFFTEATFTPTWKINDQPVENETQLYFPSQSTTSFKFGDIISVSYKFEINGINSETENLIVGAIAFDQNLSQFSLSPPIVKVGEDISLNTDDFNETELAIIEARWIINGVLIDKEVNSFIEETISSLTYPGSKLNYGDTIELLLLPKGAEVDRAFTYRATASVGLNLASLASNQPNPEADLDNDNDSIPNHLDYFRNDAQCSMVSEGIPDDLDSDRINDLDELSAVVKTNPNLKDTDSDGLSDYDEINTYFTDPTNPDTDADGYLDGVEIDINTDANNSADPGSSLNDNDFDGLSNEDELRYKTKVNVFDTDQDGLSDWYEINVSLTDPLNPDTDNDKISDGAEVRVTETNPNLADTDADGLSDGIEVVLKLNPNDQDTDGNGDLDPDEPEFDFNISIPSILYQGDLKNYKNYFSDLLVIEQGTCFRTWLANNKPTSVNYTHEVQSDSNSYQEIAFVSDKWSQIVRYDAQNKVFAGVIDLSDYDAFAASLNYDVDFTNSNLIYIGLSDGTIRRYNKQTKLFEVIFLDTGYKLPISTLINQGDILISEQVNDAGEILHAVFDLNSTVLSLPVSDPSDPPVLEPSSVTIKDFSYKNSIWSDGSKLELLSFDPNYSQTSFVKETFNTALNSPVVSFEAIDLLKPIYSPLFVENINGKSILRFGNGPGYNLSDALALQNLLTPFDFGLEHQNHRILAKSNSSFIEFTTLTKLHEDKYWRFNTQLINEATLAVVPVGHHFLAISSSEPSNSIANDGKVAFQYIVLGDEDGDTLPDWWNNLSDTLTSTEYENYQLSDDALIPDLLDGTPNADDSLTPPLLVDTDGDNICDHWEVNLFGTDPLLVDTDDDGMSDSQELSILPSAAADCSIYPAFNVISDPLNPDSDSDGILDGDEAYVHNTNPLNPDTDGDGLTDLQEISDTNTNPLNPYSGNDGTLDGDKDTDGDGLSDSDELNKYNTNINSADSDGDSLLDFEEVFTYGTNPNNKDTDGDSGDGDELDDAKEINDYGTDPSSIDTDQDGVPDAVELNIGSIYTYSSDPLNVDTDGDGLSDHYEFDFEFLYSDELFEILLMQNNQIAPLTKPNPNEVDTDGDGICDKWEALLFFTNPAEADTDGDGLSDAQELGITLPSSCDEQPDTFSISGPLTRDTDGDGILDGDEVLVLGTNPKDKDSNDNGIDDGDEDFDSDRLTNYQELYLTKTEPLNADSDGDGITDDLDHQDGDNLNNYDEINLYGTDPLKIDTDEDGINDDKEIEAGSSPIIIDTDGDGLSDYEEVNTCMTEINVSTGAEIKICLDPLNPDTDGDGLPDGEELSLGADPFIPDTDNDFLLDGADRDSPLIADRDGDGIPDGIEVHYLRTDPNSRDTDGDNLEDGYETWVYAFKYDNATNSETNTLINVGKELDIVLNSRAESAGWPDITQNPEVYKFAHNNLDRVVYDIVDVLDSSLIVGRLYVQRYANPTTNDSDKDGLFDSTEFEIERAFGVDYNEDLDDPSFDPTALNSINFKVSDPWNIRTVSTGDIDSDGDGLSDVYESKYTLTNPQNVDSDNNSILDGLENKDNDLLNNQQEILFGSDPNVFDVSIETYGLDSDGDGLLDIFETSLFDDYKILSSDSNDNGIPDGLEDIDGDSLTNIEEMTFQTDPLTKDSGLDSDGDGLTDFQENFATFTDPNNQDSNNNGTLDGQEDADNDSIDNITELRLGSDPLVVTDINNIIDSDNDGLTDYQEITFTNTDPFAPDSDFNGINDAAEDLDSDGLTNFQEMKLGTNPLVSDSDQLRKDSDGDGLVDLYEVKITNTNPLLDDSNSDGILDGQSDLDNDGLTVFVELLFGTDPLVKNKAVDSDNDGLTDAQETLLTLTDPNEPDTDRNTISDADEDPDNDGLTNLKEVTAFTDPHSFDLTDAQGDADGDRYTNLLEQTNAETSVTNPDTDDDGLPDGLEVLILGTSASQKDTDGDGLDDQIEVKSWSRREVTSGEFCTDTETRLSSVAGKDYCFSIEYSSYPTLADSDNDGIADKSVNLADNTVILDHYPLDASCHLSGDGFISNDQSIQCFSSWMAEVESISIIKQGQWEDTSAANTISHADVLFYNSDWDSIIVHNALSGTYDSPISIKDEINSIPVNLVDFEFNEADKLLYLLYSDATIETYNVQTNVAQTLGNYLEAGSLPRTLKLLNSNKLMIESENSSNKLSYTLLDSSGASLAVLEDKDLHISESVVVCFNTNTDCNESVSVYGFIKDSVGVNTNVGRLDINTVNNTFLAAIEISSPLGVDDVISGPLKASKKGDLIQLGSGQIFNLLLEDTGTTLSREHHNKPYTSYYDFVEYADHFVGVVDVDLAGVPGSEDVSQTQNGLLVAELESIKDTLEQKLPPGDSINDLKVLNQYLLSPERLEEQVLKLIPFAKTSDYDELALIKKSNNKIIIDPLGLFDEDTDLMTGLYERVFGLDDTDLGDKYLDLDNDGLSNIEEYFFATDPSNADTDGDGWMDIDEILNGTDPNNKLSY